MSYQSLDPNHIIDTVGRLTERIDMRFPDSGLGKVCRELQGVARNTAERCIEINRPIMWLRLVSGAFVLLLPAALFTVIMIFKMPDEEMKLDHFVEVLEPGVNVLVLMGIAIFFAISLETRLKRNKALHSIHELRSIAHIIDMHQLDKDPDKARTPVITVEGAKPPDHLTPEELTHYLDYCSEMLSIIGKVAALYVQRFNDPVALASVNEVESLTTGLSRKIWQKIMILNTVTVDRPIPWLDPRQ